MDRRARDSPPYRFLLNGSGLVIQLAGGVPLAQLGQHVRRHRRQIEGRLSAPLLSRHAIVNGARPRIGNRLPEVGLIIHGKPWNMALDFRGQFRG